jgi:hypothetical protein
LSRYYSRRHELESGWCDLKRAGHVGGRSKNDEFGSSWAEGVDCPGHRYGWPAWHEGGAADDVDGGWIRGIRATADCYEWSDDWRACWGCGWSWMHWLTGLDI